MRFTGLRGADGVWGGDLVDAGSPFAGRDKVVHLVLGAFLYAALDARGLPFGWAFGIVAAFAVLNEIAEGARFARYGYSRLLSDEPDGTDVLVTLAGGLLGWLIL